MKIKKLGHCCLVISENGKKIMTDPGSWTIEEHEKEKNIDLIIITHEHGDHVHINSLKKIIENNPKVKIITNSGVGKLLDEVGIEYEILKDKTPINFLGIEIEPHNCKHEEIFEEIGQVENTGYFIGKRLFYPGDSFYNPLKKVEILALPCAGPWTNVKRAVDYALSINPQFCFPVHDGMLKDYGSNHKIPSLILKEKGITFFNFETKNEVDF